MSDLLRKLGFGALIGGGIVLLVAVFVAVMLIGPLIFWLAWNVLDFGPAIGLPELGFWSIVLATLFLVVGWFGKSLIAFIVFMVDPSWFDGAATVNWPEPTFRNFVAVVLLAMLAGRPHAHAQRHGKAKETPKAPSPGDPHGGPWKEVVTEVRSAITTEIEKERGTPGGTG